MDSKPGCEYPALLNRQREIFFNRQNNEEKGMNKHLLWVLVVIGLFGCSTARPSNVGIRNGRLADCPSTPNCVSSQSADSQHFVAPLSFQGSAAEAKRRLLAVLREMKRAEITTERENYVHAEFTSLIFRFVDDVEFLIDDSNQVIHVRSASRTGTSDLGVNRRRVEEIRRKFNGRD
jgi:uncharacterized protein (DUF1499 family)